MKKVLLFLAVLLPAVAAAQFPVILHSHNDYERTAPFWEAYSQHCTSIEADVHLVDGQLLVGHDRHDLKPGFSLESMYVEPIVKLFRANGGRVWEDSADRLQLMVELKSDTEPALSAVIALLQQYPDVFCSDDGVKVVITGNIPDKARFAEYPSFVSFDGDLRESYTPDQLARIGLFSNNFRIYSAHWNGKGRMMVPELDAVEKAIARAHAAGKPIRFWNSPESFTTYFTFWKLGVDIINTDRPAAASQFFENWGNKNFIMGEHATASGVTGTRRLDRATRDFSGFQNGKMKISKPIETYTPTFRSDNASPKKIKNVIFLIGDGMGFNHVMAAAYANGLELSMLKMKATGIQVYNPLDDFIGDSAGGGSSLATGEPSWTRHISSNWDGTEPIPSMTDHFGAMGKSTGVLTLGDVADATPAAYFAHCSERDSLEHITSYWLTSNVDLICGSGRDYVEGRRSDGIDMLKGVKANGYSYITDIKGIDSTPGKVLCIDDKLGRSAEESNLDLLAEATRRSIAMLQKRSDKGFFLMVEGAKIDYAGHAKTVPAAIIETLSFDLAVAEALRFADADGQTLVIVTADHETGGLTLLDGDLSTGHVLATFVSDDHTPSVVPVFAYGPGSYAFCGTYRNYELTRILKSLVTK